MNTPEIVQKGKASIIERTNLPYSWQLYSLLCRVDNMTDNEIIAMLECPAPCDTCLFFDLCQTHKMACLDYKAWLRSGSLKKTERKLYPLDDMELEKDERGVIAK